MITNVWVQCADHKCFGAMYRVHNHNRFITDFLDPVYNILIHVCFVIM